MECTEPVSPGPTQQGSQRTLQETLNLKKIWDINSSQAKAIHRTIGEMMAVDNQPFSIVEDLGFTRLVKQLMPKYCLPSRKYFTSNVVPSIHTSVMEKVKKNVKEAEHISFTTDIWTTLSNDAFISLTGHCLGKNFDQDTVVLRVLPFPGSHTADNISLMIKDAIHEFNIEASKIHLIVHDNGANVVKGVENTGYDGLSCFLHTLQLVIHDCILEQRTVKDIIADCRKIVTHFSHSPLACSKLEALQEENKLPKHVLIQNVPTRWNSTYFMLERIFEQKNAIVKYCADSTHLPSFDGNKWSLIGKMTSLLKIFHKTTIRLSERKCLSSEIIPQVQFLNLFIDKALVDERFTGLGSTLSALKASFTKRFERYTSDYNTILATYLDPRYKNALFKVDPTNDSCKVNATNIESELFNTQVRIKELKDAENTADLIDAVSSSIESDEGSQVGGEAVLEEAIEYDFDDCFEELLASNNTKSTNKSASSTSGKTTPKSRSKETAAAEPFISIDIARYLTMEVEPKDGNPLQWWKDNMSLLPSLAPLARKYLSSPPSSIESERLFSIGGNIYSPHRNRLTADNGEMLMFLNYNLRIFHFRY